MFSQLVHLFIFNIGVAVKSALPAQVDRWLVKTFKYRIYFGNIHSMSGGPKIRTSRLISSYGNQIFMPNIIYAQSCWKEKALRQVSRKAKLNRYKIVFNQNGWYYPGWYAGDWRKCNAAIVDLQKKSQIVIYQSKFCYEAGRLLNGYEPPVSKIIYNAINLEKYKFLENRGDGKSIWLSGIFSSDALHILQPALDAFLILSSRYGKDDCPTLLISGQFTFGAKKAEWWPKMQECMFRMRERKILRWAGEYDLKNYESIAKRVDIALHLKYKDPCPNAVIERMASGIPHVFSSSGGTKELIGQAGIGLHVQDSWDKQVQVDSEELALAIEVALANKESLSLLSRARAAEFGWSKYVNEHQRIFTSI